MLSKGDKQTGIRLVAEIAKRHPVAWRLSSGEANGRPRPRTPKMSPRLMSVVGNTQAINGIFGPIRTPHMNWSMRTRGQVAPHGHHMLNHVAPPTALFNPRTGGQTPLEMFPFEWR